MATKRRLTPELFHQFITERKAIGACPFCGTFSWSLMVDENQRAGVVAVDFREIDNAMIGASVGTYASSCRNCGFIRQHRRDTVDKWLDRVEPEVTVGE